jgi:hypothetical protein
VTAVLVAACIINALGVLAASELAGLQGAAWAVVLVEGFVVVASALGAWRGGARDRRAARETHGARADSPGH